MSANLTIQFTPEAEKVLAGLKQIPQRTLQGIARGLNLANQLTVGVIQKEFLSFPKHGPTVPHGLRVQSNRLRGSIRATKAVVVGETVVAAIGSNVRYAGVHEFGFRGTVNVSAHTRKPGRSFLLGGRIVSQRAAKDLLTKAGKPRKNSGLTEIHESRAVLIDVKAHPMKVNLPARAPIRRGIAYNMATTTSIVSAEVVKSINGKGGTP